MYSFINGKYIKEPKVSIFDRGFMYGDGVFESLRTYGGKPFLLSEHLARLLNACKLLRIKISLSESGIQRIIQKLMRRNKLKEAYIKIFVTRGEAKGHGLSIKKTKGNPLLIVTTEKLNKQAKACKITIYPLPRSNWIGTRIKSLNYLEHIFARMYAEEKGADEAIFTDEKGNILEGTTSNIFIVKNDTLITAPVSAPILAGVTRDYVIRQAKADGKKVEERLFKLKELLEADSCFITSSGQGVIRCKSIS
ncbi:hypothetical protein A2276_00125 [candidate division WOR-1 bacterium RIFOXYA12_FULL_43_27]|uniref:Aminodeoxychorismate lyase n=1 Tax=candidate division WOR-1 bacterium RIFOXYC2_FULL_46_14 TaxID=1802587 RepID=A0A1F4U4D1_UNCSA|nr:MAG: hypothetical protein A2276_00125 [candidate division WOR-1 bacterium RIFOXYA12_FULL_43_27]OGC20896.1 MAG: hypothetical protein A2292_07750 [candidate division WOR-1 bacterium RIFOXYB2_FULL_46_45]OGC31366.1 MAG: hypothetical protein A2232_03695 [candidate division WOR-1 bacterium RIFOXYA2_FULL_46_56]OGC39772.1 MAG: hypothetical protein A2438_04530 [candidate division WOR-1 bacterium RIFOXYC2_FULL_46_14]